MIPEKHGRRFHALIAVKYFTFGRCYGLFARSCRFPEFIMKERSTMKRTLLIFLITAALCYGVLIQDQTQAQTQTQGSIMPPSAEKQTTLDDRFTQCMRNASCPIQVRMQIMQEENDDMILHFQKIHQTCADINFENCIDHQKEDMQKWHMANGRMQRIMRSMETGSPEKLEPSAGGSEGNREKMPWNKLWQYINGK